MEKPEDELIKVVQNSEPDIEEIAPVAPIIPTVVTDEEWDSFWGDPEPYVWKPVEAPKPEVKTLVEPEIATPPEKVDQWGDSDWDNVVLVIQSAECKCPDKPDGCTVNFSASYQVGNTPSESPLQVKMTVTIATPVGTATIDINWGDGNTDTDLSPASSPYTHIYDEEGTYFVCITAFDDMGTPEDEEDDCLHCEKMEITVVCVLELSSVSVQYGNTPSENPLQAEITPAPTGVFGTATYDIDWGDGNTDSGLTLSPYTHIYDEQGAYTVTITVTDDSGCSDEYETTVYPTCVLFGSSAGPSYGSPPSSSPLQVSVNPSPTGVYGTATYDIDWGDGDTDTGLTISPFTHLYDMEGTYVITVTVTDDSGCTDEFELVAYPECMLQITGGSISVSYGSPPASSPLQVSINPAPTSVFGSPSYDIDWGDGHSDTGMTTTPITHIYDMEGDYTINVTVSDATSCTAEASVEASPACVLELSSVSYTEASLNVTLTTSPTSVWGSPVYEIDWGDGMTSTILNHIYAAPGTYTVLVTVTDDSGCTDDHELEVEVIG